PCFWRNVCRSLPQRFAQQRQSLRKIPLFRSQPERPLRSGLQKSCAVGSRVRLAFPVQRTRMFGRSAVAIFAVPRTDSVSILRYFPSSPTNLRKRSHHVARQLRLPNAPGVPANHHDPPKRPHSSLRFHALWLPPVLRHLSAT